MNLRNEFIRIRILTVIFYEFFVFIGIVFLYSYFHYPPVAHFHNSCHNTKKYYILTSTCTHACLAEMDSTLKIIMLKLVYAENFIMFVH